MKLSRIKKLRIAEIAAAAVYGIGVGLYSAAGRAKGYREGFDAGVKAMSDAYEMNKEDNNETAQDQ